MHCNSNNLFRSFVTVLVKLESSQRCQPYWLLLMDLDTSAHLKSLHEIWMTKYLQMIMKIIQLIWLKKDVLFKKLYVIVFQCIKKDNGNYGIVNMCREHRWNFNFVLDLISFLKLHCNKHKHRFTRIKMSLLSLASLWYCVLTVSKK